MLTSNTLLPVLAGATLSSAALTYKGADWSSVTVAEAAGVSYSDASGASDDLENILADAGITTVRQRIWVNPTDGNYDLDYNVALAKRAVAAGMGVYLDLHLSDTWADAGNQAIPSGWPTALDDLTYELYNYTMAVSNAFAAADITPDIIAICNECSDGVLYPTGSYEENGFEPIAALLHSAAWGIKDSDLTTQPKIMIHLPNGWDYDLQSWFYDGLLAVGTFLDTDFDVMGVSYYPFYSASATLSALKSSLTNMASAYGKEIIVAETDWPTQCKSPEYDFPSDASHIPFSADGQTTWLQDIADVVEAVDGATGVFYWEPAWLDNAALGSSCEYNTMFSTKGEALSSLAGLGAL